MRLALKHQIILAPAIVLLLMSLLLGFLQYSYWDLSLKRQASRKLTTLFIALAEANLASQRMQALAVRFSRLEIVDVSRLEELAELHKHLKGAAKRILDLVTLSDETEKIWRQAVEDLDPEQGFDSRRFLDALNRLRPELEKLSELIQNERERLRDVHNQDIDALVARTTFVSIVVLGFSILLGIFLSLTLARRILRRIQYLSESAGRIARGDLTPPKAPEMVRDELDALALSINHMTEKLIRVVGTEKLLEGAEEERRRIAMDIHDQTLADLSSVLRGLQELKQRPDPDRLAQLEAELQKTMSSLREVMNNLHPQSLEILGLGATLEAHVEQLQAKDGAMKYHCYIQPELQDLKLPRLISLTLYRVAVEALHNVIKHARASRCEICLEKRGQGLLLVVEDNGIGMPRQVAGHGRGLNNIRERARAIGARVEWKTSRFSSGTRFELLLPLAAAGQSET
ncbi:signal transduction histidine kinase [Geothermobacter ehrlichii]|uniref:Oxygen sensor histidine kinase NreB n=1 Tax=Geothermobacter ehrlichii TaxID=213224 RepID=A0A5D3WKU0_9BACT|nr:HAMP domain-containing protein [Geothermobacter ehrlichii]TYO98110.1 signal transduction histidine kinase [Geothermobacter ehrlichii]